MYLYQDFKNRNQMKPIYNMNKDLSVFNPIEPE